MRLGETSSLLCLGANGVFPVKKPKFIRVFYHQLVNSDGLILQKCDRTPTCASESKQKVGDRTFCLSTTVVDKRAKNSRQILTKFLERNQILTKTLSQNQILTNIFDCHDSLE